MQSLCKKIEDAEVKWQSYAKCEQSWDYVQMVGVGFVHIKLTVPSHDVN